MESVERLVRTWISTGRDEEIDQMVLDISSGQSTLLNVVKALGEYLTSEEDVLRTKGVDFLSRVISRCPQEKINRQATRVLVTFYVSKLEDTETIIPALKGLVPLSSLPTFSSSDAVETTKAVFAHVDLMSHAQSTRHLVFQILDSLMARHRDALQGMGPEFLTGYTNLVDGEKDPRNLMLAFSLDRVICIEFDISHHVDRMFNIIFCYFPIAFKPPPNDQFNVTAEDLKGALRNCLSASPLFGRLAFPLFLEKLLAGSPATKKDTLETMGVCIPVFGAGAATTFAKKLWNSLKLEVFQPVNPELEAEALKTTQILIKAIYAESDDSVEAASTMKGLVKEVCEECLTLMGEPEKSQAIPASKVMAALIGTTSSTSRYALSQAIPHLMKLFRDPDEVVHRPQILTLLCIMVSAISVKRSLLEDFGLQAQLLSFKDEVLGAFIAGTKSAESREAALEGLKKLAQMDDVLTDEEFVYVVHSVNEILESSDVDSGEASDDALDVLIAIAEKNSKVVEDATLPLLFSALPDVAPARDAYGERAKCWRTLRSLARLCISAPLFETLVVRLSTKLELVCAPKSDSSDEAQDREPREAYAHSILKTLGGVMELKVNAKHSDVPKYVDRLVPRIFNLFIYLALAGENGKTPKLDPRLLNVVGHIITLIVQTVPSERQQKLARDLSCAYFNEDISQLAVGHQAMPKDVVFRPFESNSTTLQRDLVSLLSSAVIACRSGIYPTEVDPNEFLASLQSWGLDYAESHLQQESAFTMISALLNKNVESHEPFMSSQLTVFWNEELLNKARTVARRRTAIRSWIWTTKALVVRNHQSAVTFAERLLDLFDDPEIGWDAARAIGAIASGGEQVLTKQNHAVTRILYAQRYFNFIFPKIMEGAKGAIQSPKQATYLVALTSLMESLPVTTYANELLTLMPLLIRGLDIPDVEIRTSIINTLFTSSKAAGNGPTQEYATSLVPVLLKNALPQDVTSVNLRSASLRYLSILPGIVRYDILHPHKALVIRELSKCLDDPKRAVRKEAVDARTAWFMYKG